MIRELLHSVINDTLKRNGKWSRTSLTMFSSWIITCAIGIYQSFWKDFSFSVFLVFACIALSSKAADAISKRIFNK